MKCKFILGTIALSLLSASSFALQIENGKLINHKEWTSGKVSGFIKDVKVAKNKFDTLRQMKTNADTNEGILAANRIYVPLSPQVDQSTDISGFSELYLENYGQTMQNYEINSQLCIFKPQNPTPSDCVVTTDTVQLNPGGFVLMGRMPKLTTVLAESGMYTSMLYTVISKPNSSTVFATYATDFLYVT